MLSDQEMSKITPAIKQKFLQFQSIFKPAQGEMFPLDLCARYWGKTISKNVAH